jgi:hypothetical protein
MKLETLAALPPWEWPEDTSEKLLAVLLDDAAAEADRLLAVELAGDPSVTSDAVVEALLATLGGRGRSAKVRARAAISLGPVLEEADIEGFEGDGDPSISQATFDKVRDSLRALYRDTGLPTEVRRRILEASVRSPHDWHAEAVGAAYASSDADWKLTAVFCMRFVPGFDGQILEALDSEDLEIRREAVLAAGAWSVEGAWERVAALVESEDTEKPLLLAAIEAAAAIRPSEAATLLDDLSSSEDEEIAEAVEEALAAAQAAAEEDDL